MDKNHLNEVFEYNETTGDLHWRCSRKGVKAGSIAGASDKDGYIVICLNYKTLRAHRVAWVMCYGEISDGVQIDYIDHNPSNNRIENLRIVSHKENHRNQSLSKNNTSGHIGVSFAKREQKWAARLMVDGKVKGLGHFVDINEAVAARRAAQEKYGFHVNHGKAC